MEPVNLAHVHLKALLEGISNDTLPSDNSPEGGSEIALNKLNYRNFPALRRAAARLELESKNKNHDVVFRGRILAMFGTLTLYLDTSAAYTWRKASLVIAKSQGHGPHLARRVRDWLHTYLSKNELPLHKIGRHMSSLLDDEDIASKIKLHLMGVAAQNGHFRADTIVDFIASEGMQNKLEKKGIPIQGRTISVWTARRWLKALDFRFGRRKNGMYVDGHEREDVVKYRNAFTKRWVEDYEPRMAEYDNNGDWIRMPEGNLPNGQANRLILVTHDESTFFANERCNLGWIHPSFKAKPLPKGEGESLMVSDFLTPDWGRLVDGERWVPSFVTSIFHSDISTVKPAFFSELVRTATGILQTRKCLITLIMPSTSSNQRPQRAPPASLSLTMHQPT
jgi:hypothetical protein